MERTKEDAIRQLVGFREQIYRCMEKSGDSLFELIDALIEYRGGRSFVELTESGVFQRRWSSAYGGMKRGEIDREEVLKVIFEIVPKQEKPLWVVDHSIWGRPNAPTVKDRGYHHKSGGSIVGKPVGVGHDYSTLGEVVEEEGSWCLPFDSSRISSMNTPVEVAAEQLREILSYTPVRPTVLGDSEYGCAPFLKETADLRCNKLLRLRPNRVLYREPGPYCGMGRHPVHGSKFSLKDPTTWGNPEEEITLTDEKLGEIKLQRWDKLHQKEAADCPFTLIHLVRPSAKGTRRDPKEMWLIWTGEELPSLAQAWKPYLRRFTIEHFYRFIKGPLMWTKPRFKNPEEAQLWTDLVNIAYWQLWLARPIVKDLIRPWEKPSVKLTPGRVKRAMPGLLARIGTPSKVPKPRGKSSGRPKGFRPKPYIRYPVVKKAA